MNIKHKIYAVIASILFIPSISYGALTKTKGLLTDVDFIIDTLLRPIAFALALVFFFWGMAKFILKAGDEGAREEGKQVMMWGIVALFVISAIWGITAFIGDEVGVPSNGGQSSGNNSGPFIGNETSYDFPQTP